MSKRQSEPSLQTSESQQGISGVDGVIVDELGAWLHKNGKVLSKSLLKGTYKPKAIRGVQIPKSGGKGKRQLGIPTVVDRFLQQAILQILTPILDKKFSQSGYGCRPGKSAHDAIKQLSEYVAAGNTVVVDIDFEKFFDQANHDMVMFRLSKHVKDKRLLSTIRRFFNVDLMQNGVETKLPPAGHATRRPSKPTFGKLLDDFDRELERRGHKFCRYVNDCNIYVSSQRVGERVMALVTNFIEKKLKLKVNQTKSAVDTVDKRKFLGCRVFRDGSLGISPESLFRFKQKIRWITRRSRPQTLVATIREINKVLIGWINYYCLSRSARILQDQEEKFVVLGAQTTKSGRLSLDS